MARRNTRQELIDSALAYIDAHGLESLTLRSLGAELGLHHTALYRHFASKEDLLESVFRSIFGEALSGLSGDQSDPRERVIELCYAMRGVFEAHPGLSAAIVQSAGVIDEAVEIQRAVLKALREMGVPEARLSRVYQGMESYVLGSSLYDFANAPRHSVERADRFARVDDPAFVAPAASEDAATQHTADAFRWAVDALLDAAVRP